MSADEFTPRLGRPGNRGAGATKRYASKVKRAAKRLAKPKGRSGFTGARSGRGIAAARMAELRGHSFANFRMRRVIVKVYIARASKGIGKAAFRAHVKYLQRDGVDRREGRGEERGANLYDKSGERLDDRGFLDRSKDDRHQFRIIVSPEDADQLGDLKETTRAFMAEVENDLGTKLDWVAVDHHDTGHSHTHIVIRGKDAGGHDLIIARDYLTKGMRERAQGLIMERLGPRRDLEIARARASEVLKERFTKIDRGLENLECHQIISHRHGAGSDGRFERTLQLRRMATLERLGLAARLNRSDWRMSAGWQDHLRALGKRGDIIRNLGAHAGCSADVTDFALFEAGQSGQQVITGQVVADMAGDELRDRRALIVAGIDGKLWHVPLGARAPDTLPPAGAVVEVRPARNAPRQSDQTIANIAAVNGGLYSAALHTADDPGASKSYAEAHKRRLEALRRAGIVTRDGNGVWHIGPDYVQRAADHDGARAQASFTVKSWVDLETQTEARAPVWLDQVDPGHCEGKSFGAEVNSARAQRAAFLKRQGLWSDGAGAIDPALRDQLNRRLLQAAGASEAARSGRGFVTLATGARFEGVYEKSVTLATGRFALIARAKEFTLVPWRADIERHRGAAMMIKRTSKGAEWTLGKARGIGR